MAARSPRRTFATPFVVTLAAALPAACVVESRPAPRSGTASPDSMANPTAGQMSTTAPSPGGAGGSASGPAPAGAAPGDTVVVANPPRPQPPQPQPAVSPEPAPSSDRRWTVMKDGTTCRLLVEVSCPPDMMCNPPPPKATTCLPGMADGDHVKIVQKGGAGACFTEPKMPECPPGASCNPPRPQKVACPK